MAELKGTNVAAGIVPFTDQDNYPTHYSKYGKGGLKSVDTIEERDLIPAERTEEGMLCYVKNDPSEIHTYQYKDGRWRSVTIGANGIPIYNKETLDVLGQDAEEKHIYLRSEGDLDGEIVNQTYQTSQNGSYLDILFSTIRQLQVEVARMRNAFKYGMYSYTGTDTAMSGVVGDIQEPEEEPLWAVEPDMLSLIAGADVPINSNVQNLTPISNVNPRTGKLVLIDTVNWFDKDDLVKICEDSKLFIYFTLSHLNLDLVLEEVGGSDLLRIVLSDLSKNIIHLDKYNLMVVISRKSETLGGKNFVWISISNPETSVTLKEGYYDLATETFVSSIKELDKAYTVKSIEMTNLDLYQLDFYSKYQEFTQDTIPSKPNDQDYKYKVAHITIRSVTNKEELESIKNQLPNNELIFEEATSKLWIKNNNRLVTILGSGGGESGGDSDNDGINMTDQQLIEKLKELGIVYETTVDGESSLQLSSIADITFIHQATGKSFKFEVDSEGSLVSSEIPGETLESRIEALRKTSYAINQEDGIRGFVAKIHCSENKGNPIEAKDVKINSDRVKIGAVYMPLETDTMFGCSHAYVELENTSDKDFPLNGCYLHYLHPDSNNNNKVEHLKLEGIIPAGSTFLIRGKKYSDPTTNSGTFISVDSYDMEWYIDSELVDFTIKADYPYGFALTYGEPNLSEGTALYSSNQDSDTLEKAPYIYKWFFIDSLPINKQVDKKPWGFNYIAPSSNSIIKNMFMLDPAKQAFQALNTYDSSRYRLEKIATDIQVLSLAKETITFPHSEEEFPISYFAPKSSKEKKNVCSDKTKFDMNKPNAVNCSFGIDVYKTRCFNWVSGGEFNEYVWIKDGSGWKKFESYKKISSKNTESSIYPRKKEFDVEINNAVYARMSGNFPGCGIHYTAHKCIIDVVSEPVNTPTTYTYIVGRADKTGLVPDTQHCSEEYTFTLYPESYTPRVYQTTDQQGFHWVEYQVWSAAANFIAEKIDSEISAEGNIFPVLINTGDMTQNGTRVNEWLDYFNGGKALLNHLEHMAVVGNNDLCGPNPETLGTGDDSGKSNSYYFHVFFCYEVFKFDKQEEDLGKVVEPIINGKYIPSLYYFDTKDYRFVMANSEITYATCKTWYGLDASADGKDRVYNAYTGHLVVNNNTDTAVSYSGDFVSIYTMMWNMFNSCGSKRIIAACHEMPFTVITTQCIAVSTNKVSRSVSGSSLVGCHMNQLSPNDNKKGLYWFSRLCEYFNVRLVLGGHKHTYTSTLPIREYYFYNDGEAKNSKDNGPMVMLETLENDSATWVLESGEHTSKLPLLLNYSESGYPNSDDRYFWPYTEETITGTDTYKDNRVIYFMCQATGYKQTSNKELPTNFQSFSSVIPQSKITITDGKVTKSEADNNQKYPMFVRLTLGESNWEVRLSRICNIQNSNYKFNQTAYGTADMEEEFATVNSESKYCNWSTNNSALLNITL